MKPRTLVLIAALLLAAVALADRLPPPTFLAQLDPDAPGDAVLRTYWARAAEGAATPAELVDLGTMLLYRGFPVEAEAVLEQAVDADRKIVEGWFRLGLARHSLGELDSARAAYERCLKLLVGHGWCNFYLARLEEIEGNPRAAVDHYRRAFKAAPELADPEVNPEVLYAELDLAALLVLEPKDRFMASAPFDYVDPARVAEEFARVAPAPAAEAPPEPSAEPSAEPAPAPAAPRRQLGSRQLAPPEQRTPGASGVQLPEMLDVSPDRLMPAVPDVSPDQLVPR